MGVTMPDTHTAFAHPATVLTLAVFRLNGALIALGDAVVAPLGLTSARWQVMGAIAQGAGALPVASIARNMGLVRQSVQRIVDEMKTEGLIDFVPNPHHRRAKLVQLSEHGETVFGEAGARWLAIADGLVGDMTREEADRGASLLGLLRTRAELMHPSR